MTITRRNLLGTAGAAAAGSLPVAARGLPAPTTTAEPLVGRLEAWRRAHAAHSAACDRYSAAEGPIFQAKRLGIPATAEQTTVCAAAEAGAEEACGREVDAMDRIAQTPAQTSLGMLIKLRLALYYLTGGKPLDLDLEKLGEFSEQKRLLISVAGDAERLLADGRVT